MNDEFHNDNEASRRRDEVVRRMANTPPQPKLITQNHHPKNKKKADADRAVRRPSAVLLSNAQHLSIP
jgi:hypothetical protein